MAKYEEKFLVINFKRFDELNNKCSQGTFGFIPNQAVLSLMEALNNFKETYEANVKPLDQKYYVCNQDEPYAQEVFDIILKGETDKETKQIESKAY